MTELDPENDDLARALRAPGTATELQDEERYLAMFRAESAVVPGSAVRSLPRRTVGRLGAGGTAVVVTVVLTSGVAAAYTGHLPDPVQQLAHQVIGAPAPDSGPSHHRLRAAGGPGTTHQPAGTGSTGTSPAAAPSSPASPSSRATTGASPGSPTSAPSGHATKPVSASGGPSGSPTSSPNSSGAAGAVPSGLTLVAATHRVGVGEPMTFSTVLTDADGTAIPDHPAVLQVRGAQRWRKLAGTTTDAVGAATVTTPPLTRSAVFRWRTDHHVHSTPWLVRLVPDVSATADVGGSATIVTATADGARAGDRVQLLRRGRQGLVPVRHGRLDATGAITFTVVTPRHRTPYVVRLVATPRHTAAHAHVVVVPPAAAGLTIGAATHRVVVGATAALSGAVTAPDGGALSGQRVVLQRRGAARWRAVGHGTSDASGSISLSTPPILQTGWYRLRTGHGVHSPAWRVVEVPVVSVSATRSGTTVGVSARVQGGHGGDRVVLRRRKAGGGLVTLGHTTLAADGTAAFTVPARRVATTYVVRMSPTRRHAAASGSVTVPRAAG